MYEVIRPIAMGHQGDVHLARADDGRLVALKRLSSFGTLEARQTAERRLRREAELLGGLDIDGVVPLLDVYEDEGPDGTEIVLVMPYLPGGTLEAVAALHRRGVIHRDIKPSNVLFDAASGGRPWLVDFGIGISRDITEGLSADGHLLGTPSFIAPERARGEPATNASDIYSLGATLRYALSGMPPHGIGDVVTIVGRAAAGRVEPLPPTVPTHVVEVLDRMCALDPEDRPTTAELLPGPEGTALAPAAAPNSPPARTARGRWRVALAAVAGVLLLLTGVGVGMVVAADEDGGDAGTAASAEPARSSDATTAPSTTTTTCTDRAYQPCGQDAPAPNTDGDACIEPRVDHDEDPTNGCEATPDAVDDVELTDDKVEGTIVPVGDVDKVLVPLPDRWQLFCDARVRLLLTAPEGLDLEMQIFDDGRNIGTIAAARGETAIAEMSEPSCARNDSTTLEVVIRGVAGRSSDAWILEREGSW